MHNGILSLLGRSFSWPLGVCLLVSGCGDGAAKNDAQATAPASASSLQAVTPPALLPPTDRYAAGDRYASMPRVDPAVQPAGHATPTAATTTSGGGPGTLPAGEEPTFVPGIEDLQLFEQTPPGLQRLNGGGSSYDPNYSIKPSTGAGRADPLPHSP